MLKWIPVILLLASLSSAQITQVADFFRITQSTSHSVNTPGAWRYSITPRTAEARTYWKITTESYTRDLRLGLVVHFGAYDLRLQGKELALSPGCKTVDPSCFSRILPPPGRQAWRVNLILIDASNALLDSLHGAIKRADPYPATITLSGFFRLEVRSSSDIRAYPSGWKP